MQQVQEARKKQLAIGRFDSALTIRRVDGVAVASVGAGR